MNADGRILKSKEEEVAFVLAGWQTWIGRCTSCSQGARLLGVYSDSGHRILRAMGCREYREHVQESGIETEVRNGEVGKITEKNPEG